jgi:hypothetical protein
LDFRGGVARNFQVFDPPDFIAELTYVRDLELVDLESVPESRPPEPVWSPG